MSLHKPTPLSDEELAAFEATRDLSTELKHALQDFREGRGRVVYSSLIAARKAAGATQQHFAEFVGVSAETLENWEQQRRQPSKAALMMIAIALSNSVPKSSVESVIDMAAKMICGYSHFIS